MREANRIEGCVSRMNIPVAEWLEHQISVHKVLDWSHSGTKMLPCPIVMTCEKVVITGPTVLKYSLPYNCRSLKGLPQKSEV